MNFQYFRPSGILSRYIKHYWVMECEGSGEEITERVIPTGNIELMFHYGLPFKTTLAEGGLSSQPRSFISGISSNYADVSTSGTTGVIAVTFYPYGACNFFRFPMHEIADSNVNLHDIFQSDYRFVEEQFCSASSIPERIAIVEQFLVRQFTPVNPNDFSFLNYSVSLINQHKGKISSSVLSKQLLVSPRSLERKFSGLIGKTPKQFVRIVRFQETIRSLSVCQSRGLTSLAYENGYFDQAHFIHDFKSMSGYTPREFLTFCPCRSDYSGGD